MSTPNADTKYAAVVVTGGSSGIGEEFIAQLREYTGLETICNLSRSNPKKDFFDERFHHISVDLSQESEIDRVENELRSLLTGVNGPILFINNSGFGDYGHFADGEREKLLRMLDLNVRSYIDLTHRFLPLLQEKGGTVLCVVSTAAFQPCPMLAVYGATKAFLLNWCMAINNELKGTGVNVIAHCPGPTKSNFFKEAGFEGSKLDVTGMKTPDCVRHGLKLVERGRSYGVPGLIPKITGFFGRLMPLGLVTYSGGIVLRKIRKQ